MDTLEHRLQLWHAIECPHSMRVRLVLAEKELQYRSNVVTLDDVGDVVRRLNPKAEVPVLVDDGCAVCDALVIAEYVDRQFSGRRLCPEGAAAIARARLIIAWADAKLIPAHDALEEDYARGVPPSEAARGPRAEHQRRIRECLRTLANQLPQTEFMFGPVSIVDLFLAPLVTNLDALGIRRDETPHAVAAWIDRLRDRPSIAAEVSRRQDELRPTGS